MVFVIDKKIAHNDVQTMTQVFFQHMGFRVVQAVPQKGMALEFLTESGIIVNFYEDGQIIDKEYQAEKPFGVKTAIFNLLARQTGYRPPWGTLIGIRPTKIAHEILDGGHSEADCAAILAERYFAHPEKARLCAGVAGYQRGILCEPQNPVAALYIGIPFCPSRCLYCSFASYPVAKFGNRMDDYTDALIREIGGIARIAGDCPIESIYIGGGTPTALDTYNFQRVLAAIAVHFDTANASEYTVEAGRPDTINPENLRIMTDFGVNRISINCQSANDSTLAQIGRGHTFADFCRAWWMARDAGFAHINADIILGLALERAGDVENTLAALLPMGPDSVTVHTLAVKRASRLRDELGDHNIAAAQQMVEMVDTAAKALSRAGFAPYYLYRQKNSPGNHENVGWCKPGKHGLYNIQIMEERQNLFAAGAGAISKHIDPAKNLIRRAFNVKELGEYIARIDEMILRKAELWGK